MKTETWWPEGLLPTDDDMATWLSICTREERVEYVRRARTAFEESERCFVRNHEGRIKYLEAALQRVTEQRDDAHAWLLGDRPTKEKA